MAVSPRVSIQRSPRRQSGFVLVWFAILMVVLLGFAGFAVDWALAQKVKTDMQKAADAAALSGAVFLPDDPSQARSVATNTASRNGYASGVTVETSDNDTGEPALKPNQIRVTIEKQVSTLFMRILGRGTLTPRVDATAEFERPIAMGSPDNQFGNDPDAPGLSLPGGIGSDDYPGFWANAHGRTYQKGHGDAILSTNCADTDGSTSGGYAYPDSCSGSTGGPNLDFDAEGYYYTARLLTSGSTTIEVFDPAFVQTSLTCLWDSTHPPTLDTDYKDGNLEEAVAALDPNFLAEEMGPAWPYDDDPDTRYRHVENDDLETDAGLRYCTGDNLETPASDTPATWTYTVWGPAEVPGEPSTVPSSPVCSVSFPGFVGDLSVQLNNASPLPGGPAEPLARLFRQWYPICTINGSAGTDYFVQVTSSTGKGENHFAMRANGAGANIFGTGKMSIYQNIPTNAAEFYLARVLPSSSQRTLVLKFWDIGDIGGGSGTATIEPPADAGAPASFTGCEVSGVPGYSSPEYDDFSPSPSCSISGIRYPTYNMQWVVVRIPLDQTYDCDEENPSGCYLKMNLVFSGGSVFDTTTWTAYMEGDPVRLIE